MVITKNARTSPYFPVAEGTEFGEAPRVLLNPSTALEDPIAPSVIIPSAGACTRMGFSKPLMAYGGRTLIEAHVASYLELGWELIVVLGFAAERVRERIPNGVKSVMNPSWGRSGPIESLCCGLAALDPCGVGLVFVQPIDILPPPRELLLRMAAMELTCVPVHGTARGHPVALERRLVREILQDPPRSGLRERLGGAILVPCTEERILGNLNTPLDWMDAIRRS